MPKKSKNVIDINEEILRTLNKILKVLSIQVAPDRSITERIKILKTAGFAAAEISEILNLPISSVRTIYTRLKKDE